MLFISDPCMDGYEPNESKTACVLCQFGYYKNKTYSEGSGEISGDSSGDSSGESFGDSASDSSGESSGDSSDEKSFDTTKWSDPCTKCDDEVNNSTVKEGSIGYEKCIGKCIGLLI